MTASGNHGQAQGLGDINTNSAPPQLAAFAGSKNASNIPSMFVAFLVVKNRTRVEDAILEGGTVLDAAVPADLASQILRFRFV